MKLIIDIPEEVHKGLVTESHIFVKPIFDAIKNGIPLDKIRAEIEKPLRVERYADTESAKAQAIALSWCLEVIDKYTK